MSIRLMIFRMTNVLPKMVCLIVDSPTAFLPNQPLTKREFIANVTIPDLANLSMCNPVRYQ